MIWEQMVRLVFSAAASLVAAMLAWSHTSMQHYNTLHFGSKVPIVASWIWWMGPWAVLVSAAVLVGGILFRNRPLVFCVFVQTGWLFAVIWPVFCIVAWSAATSL